MVNMCFIPFAAHLTAHIQPQQQTIDVGRPAKFNCSYSGHPVKGVSWFKDGSPLFEDGVRVKISGSRVLLTLLSVQREDSGMYQCFVLNDMESAQGTAQLLLGGERRFFLFAFSSGLPCGSSVYEKKFNRKSGKLPISPLKIQGVCVDQ